MGENPRAHCSVCKHKGIRCPEDCFFAPFFPPHSPNADQDFIDVNRHFGINKFKSLIQAAPGDRQKIIADSLKFEANYWRYDPDMGSAGLLKSLYSHLKKAEQHNYRKEFRAKPQTFVKILDRLCDTSDVVLQQQLQVQSSMAHDAILANPSKFEESLGLCKDVEYSKEEAEEWADSILPGPQL